MEDELEGGRRRQLFTSSREHTHSFRAILRSIQDHGRRREGGRHRRQPCLQHALTRLTFGVSAPAEKEVSTLHIARKKAKRAIKAHQSCLGLCREHEEENPSSLVP